MYSISESISNTYKRAIYFHKTNIDYIFVFRYLNVYFCSIKKNDFFFIKSKYGFK